MPVQFSPKHETSAGTVSTQLPSITFASVTASDQSEVGASPRGVRSWRQDCLRRMTDEIGYLTRQSELEKRRLYSVNSALQQARQELEKGRTKNLIQDDSKKAKLHSLRQRLATATATLHQRKAENEDYKKAIDSLRLERKNMPEADDAFRVNVRQMTAQCQKYTAQSEEHRQETADCREKIVSLRNEREKQRKKFQKTVTDLTKEVHRLDGAKPEKPVFDDKPDPTTGYIVPADEKKFSIPETQRRILKIVFLNCIQRHRMKNDFQKNVEVFKRAFATINKCTGIRDVEQIMRIFNRLDERNFSLTTYVNHLDLEAKRVCHARMELLERQKEAGAKVHEMQAKREQGLSALRSRLWNVLTENKLMEERIAYFEGVCNAVIPRIREVCMRLAAIEDKPMNAEGSGDIAAMLAMIQNCVSCYNPASASPAKRDKKVLFLSAPHEIRYKNAKDRILVRAADLPSVLDDDDDDDESQYETDRVMPLGIGELRQRVEKAQASAKWRASGQYSARSSKMAAGRHSSRGSVTSTAFSRAKGFLQAGTRLIGTDDNLVADSD